MAAPVTFRSTTGLRWANPPTNVQRPRGFAANTNRPPVFEPEPVSPSAFRAIMGETLSALGGAETVVPLAAGVGIGFALAWAVDAPNPLLWRELVFPGTWSAPAGAYRQMKSATWGWNLPGIVRTDSLDEEVEPYPGKTTEPPYKFWGMATYRHFMADERAHDQYSYQDWHPVPGKSWKNRWWFTETFPKPNGDPVVAPKIVVSPMPVFSPTVTPRPRYRRHLQPRVRVRPVQRVGPDPFAFTVPVSGRPVASSPVGRSPVGVTERKMRLDPVVYHAFKRFLDGGFGIVEALDALARASGWRYNRFIGGTYAYNQAYWLFVTGAIARVDFVEAMEAYLYDQVDDFAWAMIGHGSAGASGALGQSSGFQTGLAL